MPIENMTRQQLSRMIFPRLILGIGLLFLIVILPGGFGFYWQGWLYLLTMLTPMIYFMNYLFKNDPELLARRMQMREKKKEQKLIILFSYPVILLIFILPGIDHQLGWSNVPDVIVLLSLVIFLYGYLFFFQVMKANSYASRIIEVAAEQKVISTGPYAIIRHPMYASVVIMYTFTPLALGSYWAVIPSLFVIPVLVARILNEEKVLVSELPGYDEYRQKVKYRLIPYVW